MAEVTIRDLKKSYDDLQVLHGLDIDIHDGEFVATGSSFEICMRKMKRIKTKEKLSQGASNPLADML